MFLKKFTIKIIFQSELAIILREPGMPIQDQWMDAKPTLSQQYLNRYYSMILSLCFYKLSKKEPKTHRKLDYYKHYNQNYDPAHPYLHDEIH